VVRETLAFGPFRLDRRGHRLLREGEPVALSAHLVDLLLVLTSRPGELLTKQVLFDAVWPGVFVTDNALARAVADLRRALDDDPRRPRFIQTVARRGYRFVADVETEDAGAASPPRRADGYDALRSFVASVADLEQLRVDKLAETRVRLEQAALGLPDYAPVHVALASAWTLTHESTRATARPDRAAAEQGVRSARRACELDPGLAEAWATLAFALTSAGQSSEACAAARQAVRLEPGSWRHHFRLALAAWGEERLRAVRRTLALLPGFPYACFLGATVLVARDQLEAAGDLTRDGLDRSHAVASDERLPSAGLHWLTGALASVDPASHQRALDEFALEIAGHAPERLYSTEFVVNARHWRSALLVRFGRVDEALDDLRAALALTPDHARSLSALAALLERVGSLSESRAIRGREDAALAALVEAGRDGEAALTEATRAALAGDGAAAGAAVARLLDNAQTGHTGWTLPIEPWLQHLRGTPAFDALLRRLARRAA